MKHTILTLALSAGMSLPLLGVMTLPDVYTATKTFTVNDSFASGSLNGLSDSQTLSLADFGSGAPSNLRITSISITLNVAPNSLVPDFLAGDLYATLTHGTASTSPKAVLLNRIGVGAMVDIPEGAYVDAVGTAGTGLQNLTLTSAPGYTDVHFAFPVLDPMGNPITYDLLSGIYQPDARDLDPVATDPADYATAARTAGFNLFTGTDPTGVWTLYIADVVSDPQLIDWTINLTAEEWNGVAPIPEPATLLAGLLLLLPFAPKGLKFLRKKSTV